MKRFDHFYLIFSMMANSLALFWQASPFELFLISRFSAPSVLFSSFKFSLAVFSFFPPQGASYINVAAAAILPLMPSAPCAVGVLKKGMKTRGQSRYLSRTLKTLSKILRSRICWLKRSGRVLLQSSFFEGISVPRNSLDGGLAS